MEENIKNAETHKIFNFIIAEILACVSFIFNTICVMTADRGGAWAPAWVPKFNLFYWLKTTLAIIGLFYFFTSRVFTTKQIPRYISIFTLIILWYSIPLVNTNFILIVGPLFKALQMLSLSPPSFEYEDRIPIQLIWSLPAFIVVINLLIKLARIQRK